MKTRKKVGRAKHKQRGRAVMRRMAKEAADKSKKAARKVDGK